VSTPVVARTSAELADAKQRLSQERGSASVAFVPTMGALHDGHVQLMKHARPLASTLVVSIFVNPTQFAAGEDFEDYPRTLDADVERCAEAGVDIIFAPTVATMYPDGPETSITVDPGPLATILEGASRPTHFRGVLTVVSKLFGLVKPDVAVFGEKDYQQLALIRLMARDLSMGVEIVGCPTVREADGLAMSSRNRYLEPAQREAAASLSAALRAGAAAASQGAEAVLAAARHVIEAADVELDYLELKSADLGEPVPGHDARLLIAARVGKPRLLDNMGLTLAPRPADLTSQGA
jgi:pantoate--beta-alanine ligase